MSSTTREQREPLNIAAVAEVRTRRFPMEDYMRNLLLAGAAGLFIIGAASTASAYTANPNAPNWSPYTIMGFAGDDNIAANPGYGGNPGYAVGTGPGDEGRAAYVEPMHHRHWRQPASEGDQPSGYDNTRQNPAYPPGEPGGGY
jgi:hypothetical protein